MSTPRVELTPLAIEDAARLLDYRGDPDVCRYQSFEPASIEDARAFIEGALAAHPSGAPGQWRQFGVRLREGGDLVGDVGYRISADEQAEVGVTIAPDRQRQGFGAEALAALLDHLFGDLDLHRAYASIDPRNVASMALFERLGMREEARLSQSVWFKGEWADDAVFAMLDSEWSARRACGAVPSGPEAGS